jgi:protein dithiol:quinone oxidoreductase
MALNFASRRSVGIGRAFFWAGLGCFAVVGVALVLQHGFDMKPCVWCTFQRLIYLVAGLLLLLASRVVMARNPNLGLGLGLALLVEMVAAGGLWAALHQHFVASASASCDLTLADRVIMAVDLDKLLPWLFKANASCDQANIPLLGLPFALWSAIAFGILMLIAFLGMARLIRNGR